MKILITMLAGLLLLAVPAVAQDYEKGSEAYERTEKYGLSPFMEPEELAATFEGKLWAVHIRQPKGVFPEALSDFFVLNFENRKPGAKTAAVKIGYLYKKPFSTEDATWAIKSDALCIRSKHGIICLTFRGPSPYWDVRHLGALIGFTDREDRFASSIEAVRLDFGISEVLKGEGNISVGPVKVKLPEGQTWEFHGIKFHPYTREISVGWSREDKFGIGVRWIKSDKHADKFADTWRDLSPAFREIEPGSKMENVTFTDVNLPQASCIRVTGIHAETTFQAVQYCLVSQKAELYLIELDVIEENGDDFRAFLEQSEPILDNFSVAPDD